MSCASGMSRVATRSATINSCGATTSFTAAPAALYRGERLAPLFARTASRLTEMQSEEYLSREHRP